MTATMDREQLLVELQRVTAQIAWARRGRGAEVPAESVSDILGDVAVLIAQYDSRRASAEPPASHLRIVGDDEGVAQIDTPAEPKSDLQRTIDDADRIMGRVRRRRDRMEGLDPDRPLATVVSLAERRAAAVETVAELSPMGDSSQPQSLRLRSEPIGSVLRPLRAVDPADDVRFDVRPLVARAGGVTALARLVGCSRGMVHRAAHGDGVRQPEADAWACALGLHPAEVWGDLWWDAVAVRPNL